MKYEEVYLTEYRTAEEAQAAIRRFVEQVCNQKRRQSSLAYLLPARFKIQQNQPPIYVLTNPA